MTQHKFACYSYENKCCISEDAVAVMDFYVNCNSSFLKRKWWQHLFFPSIITYPEKKNSARFKHLTFCVINIPCFQMVILGKWTREGSSVPISLEWRGAESTDLSALCGNQQKLWAVQSFPFSGWSRGICHTSALAFFAFSPFLHLLARF